MRKRHEDKHVAQRPRAKKRRLKRPCKVTGKEKFETALDALLEHSTNPRRMRAYKCPYCDFFHVATIRGTP